MVTSPKRMSDSSCLTSLSVIQLTENSIPKEPSLEMAVECKYLYHCFYQSWLPIIGKFILTECKLRKKFPFSSKLFSAIKRE